MYVTQPVRVGYSYVRIAYIDTIRWPKETNKSGRKFDFYYEFFKDPLDNFQK